MSINRSIDTRMMRDRDASMGGDRSQQHVGSDIDTLTDGTNVPGETGDPQGYGDQGVEANTTEANDSRGSADVSDMGENGPNRGNTGLAGNMEGGNSSKYIGTSGTSYDDSSGSVDATDLGTSTGSGGNWGDPGVTSDSGSGLGTRS